MTRQDVATSWTVAAVVFGLYLFTFASVPTSDGFTFIAWIDSAVSPRGERLPMMSNAPFGYYLAYLLKRSSVAAHLEVPTLWILQGVNAAAAAAGSIALYRTLRTCGGSTFWACLVVMLAMTSYGVWYFANGEVHHVALAILLWLFFFVTVLRRQVVGPSPYLKLGALGGLNAVAVFFHQEHFLFGLVVVTLLVTGRQWRRGVRESLAYAVAGSAGTFLLIFVVGRVLTGARTLGDILAWYFWPIGWLVGGYEPEPMWIIASRLVKGEMTAFVYGVQIISDALRNYGLWKFGPVRVLSVLTVLALLLAARLLGESWRQRRKLPDDLRALAAGATVWLLVYPVLLSWFHPAETEYYLKTIPPLAILMAVGPIAVERAGRTSRRLRPIGAALLVLVFVVNVGAAIVPWYRYGLMRERVTAIVTPRFTAGDLTISIESGLDAVFAGHVEQLPMKDLLYREGKKRGFEVVEAEIDARLKANRRVYVYNLVPSRGTLTGLNALDRNPYHDRYEAADFEALVSRLQSRFDLVPIVKYWEESQEPLYLYGRRKEQVFEVRPRS